MSLLKKSESNRNNETLNSKSVLEKVLTNTPTKEKLTFGVYYIYLKFMNRITLVFSTKYEKTTDFLMYWLIHSDRSRFI